VKLSAVKLNSDGARLERRSFRCGQAYSASHSMVAYYSPFNLRTLSDRVLSNSRTKETETDQVTKVGKKKKKEKRKEEKYNSFLYAKPTRVLYVSLLILIYYAPTM
jgi:hypothetical protein